MDSGIRIQIGVPSDLVGQAADLFCQAFEQKLSPFLGPPSRAARFLETGLATDRAFVALSDDGLVGIAGVKLDGRGLFEPSVGQFFKEYHLSAPFRLLGLMVLDRKEEAGCLLMDGIAVDASARGQGIGTRLLQAVEDHARQLGRTSIRLDVIDTNPGARRLYERFGFVAHETTGVGPLRLIFPFRSSTEMRKPVAESA